MRTTIIILVLVATPCCAAPFTDFDGARTLDPGEREVTVGASSMRLVGIGETDSSWGDGYEAGVRIGGEGPREARLRLARLRHDRGTATMLGFALKFATDDQRWALSLLSSFASDDGRGSLLPMLVPTGHVTLAPHPAVDLNGGVKTHFLANGVLALTVNAGMAVRVGRWVVRPEAGRLQAANGAAWQVGIALGRRFGSQDGSPPRL